jgi:hypothetical protein
MKQLLVILALAFTAIVPSTLRADSIGLTLTTGVGTDLLVETPILNGTQWTYTNVTLGALNNALLQASTSTVTITYTKTIDGLGLLNVNDLCTSVTVLGSPVPCQQFALTYTNLTLGDLSLVAAAGMNVNLNAGTGLITFGGNGLSVAGVNIAGGSAQIQAAPTPAAATPEPSTLCFLATGALSAAGVLRKRFAQAVR